MVFGVFDGLHDGHRKFFEEAKQQGDYLIAVVTQDHIVQELKGKQPHLSLRERFEHLKSADHVDAVIPGDSELGAWHVLDMHRPDVIALGYDQTALNGELQKYFARADWRPDIKIMRGHEPNRLHSSLLKKIATSG